GLTATSHYLSTRGLAPLVNGDALPALPDIEFIALAAKRLSQPARTLLELLEASDLSTPGADADA
ncbi:LysR family transcriptional regulator, partial [Burkholderia sp. Ac-20392]|nr:LysR family transcriptional regulator [Burkholderia sp. Ac-20392]